MIARKRECRFLAGCEQAIVGEVVRRYQRASDGDAICHAVLRGRLMT